MDWHSVGRGSFIQSLVAVWRFKPFLSVGWLVHLYSLWRFMVQKLLMVSVLRKKVKKRKWFVV